MRRTKRSITLTIAILACVTCGFFYRANISFAQNSDASSAVQGDSTLILAPTGLAEKEQQVLEKRYRYEFRRKDIIQEPFISTPFVKEPSISSIGSKSITEDEKLYRYFGIASVLYEAGRLEEALEILKYITQKRPEDQYVKEYFIKVQREFNKKEKEWRITSKRDADVLKQIKVKNLIKDGVVYYKQKAYDLALLKFADVLNLEPDNTTAKMYIDRLKDYYMEEIRVQGIVEEWEGRDPAERTNGEAVAVSDDTGAGSNKNDIAFQITQIINGLLDIAELKQKGMDPKSAGAMQDLLDNTEKSNEYRSFERRQVALNLLDKEEMESVVEGVRISSLMDEAELGLRIEEIIVKRKEEEKRENSYTLGPGDGLRISVQDHPELSGNTGVGPSGDIVLPLINEPIVAGGFTAEEVRKEVYETLKRYVKDPVVYVGITAYKSKIFYVIDEVGCTPYNITRANFTLRDALFTADWGNNRALGRILVMRPHKLHPMIKKVDGFDLVYRGNLSNNIRIQNGDVIYVPLTIANKISTVIADSLSPIKAVRDVRDEWINQRWNEDQGWGNLFRIPRNKALQEMYKASSAETSN